MSHFRHYTWDSDDSDDNFPPHSGFSQNRDPSAYLRLVIDDPSSNEGTEQSISEEEEEEQGADVNLSRAFDELALSSQSALARHQRNMERCNEATSVTSIVEEIHVKSPKRKPSMDVDCASNVDTGKEHDDTVRKGRITAQKSPLHESLDDILEHDDTSTVVQEGRIKTPKRMLPLDDDGDVSLDDSSLDHDDISTVLQEGRTKTPKRKPPMDDQDEFLDDSSLELDTRFSLQDRPAKVPEPSSETDSLNEEDSAVVINSDHEAALKTPAKPKMAKDVMTFGDDFDNCAWALDTESDVVFLSADQYAIPNVSWPELRIPTELYKRLYSHQKAGVQWMASLYSNRIGGILGDGT